VACLKETLFSGPSRKKTRVKGYTAYRQLLVDVGRRAR
jgi:hypothetical protein